MPITRSAIAPVPSVHHNALVNSLLASSELNQVQGMFVFHISYNSYCHKINRNYYSLSKSFSNSTFSLESPIRGTSLGKTVELLIGPTKTLYIKENTVFEGLCFLHNFELEAPP